MTPAAVLNCVAELLRTETFWVAVGAVGTILTLVFIRAQILLAKNVAAYELLHKEDDRFRSDEMRANRSNLARALLLGATHEELDKSDYADSVLDQFEDLGSMLKNKVVPARFVWTTHAWYILRYWAAISSYIEWIRQKHHDATYFSEFEYLYRRIRRLEERAIRREFSIAAHELNAFLIEELEDETEPFTLRAVMPLDLARVVEIEASTFSRAYAYPAHQFAELYRKHPNGFLVADLLGKKVVGYVIGYVSEEGVGQIDSLAVDPDFQGMGVGQKLMQATLDCFNREHVNKASLEVSTANERAQRFFESLGFAKATILKDYYATGLDAYRMEKYLSRKCQDGAEGA
jgi:[ribosomal protein S18]-alanine N-acetyltransferase